MADGRRLHGEGTEHEQDYVQERLTYGSSTDELAEQNRQLEQKLDEIEALRQGGSDQQVNADQLANEAQLNVDQPRDLQGTQQETANSTNVDLEQMRPDEEARQRSVERSSPGMGQDNIGS